MSERITAIDFQLTDKELRDLKEGRMIALRLEGDNPLTVFLSSKACIDKNREEQKDREGGR